MEAHKKGQAVEQAKGGKGRRTCRWAGRREKGRRVGQDTLKTGRQGKIHIYKINHIFT